MKFSNALLVLAVAAAMLASAQMPVSAQHGPVVYGSHPNIPASPAESPSGSQGDGTQYRITVFNKSSKDLWITYYKGSYEFEGQAGTQCLPPGTSDSFSYTSWQNYAAPEVRAEKKSTVNCGGKSTDDEHIKPIVQTDGSTTVTISDNGMNGVRMSSNH